MDDMRDDAWLADDGESEEFDEFDKAAEELSLARPDQGAQTLAPRAVSDLAIDPAEVAAEYEAVLLGREVLENLSATPAPVDSDDDLAETIVGSTAVWRGSYLNVDAVDIELPNGKTAVHEVIRHPGAVAIIAIDGMGRILLVHQYRTALERVTREIPAGKLNPGEEIEDCARRELEEETGYRAGEMRYLIPVAMAPGYSDEIIHLFMATDLVRGEVHPDEDEFISVEWADLKDFINEVLDGKVEDSKTIIAAFICDAIAHRL